ncbi:hypothetical protein [Longimicrobium sp.]|uniref:hypothetical protein n=1 Tax=Longimicrobium sp. TaxID=2029185 RepID=UPI002E36A1D7|nr:hypothetical protein [Longimicrobium sp.]HEX6041807.1 hypothetical protein [Longimicrobium sp.]
MSAMEWTVPLPAAAPAAVDNNGAAALVAAFLAATAALPPDAAARLAGVRVETLRKWRRRVPRWLKAQTARRLAAHLAGEPPVDTRPDEGLRRAFLGTLRAAPAEGR